MVSFEEIHLRINDIYFKNLIVFSINEKHEKDIEQVKEIRGYGNSTLTIYRVNPHFFFSIKFMQNLTLYLKNHLDSNVVLIYEGYSLKTIKLAFRTLGIQISGGNNTLKHILSPQQFLLSKIISIFYGYNMDLVSKSFLEISKNKALTRVVIDFTSEKDRLFLQKIKDEKEAYLKQGETNK
jgi:hypothetical protein